MEHNPYITLNDDTEITYSDIKTDKDGNNYISVYFETPKDFGFSSMQINYPSEQIINTDRYSIPEIENLFHYFRKVAKLCFEFALEDK